MRCVKYPAKSTKKFTRVFKLKGLSCVLETRAKKVVRRKNHCSATNKPEISQIWKGFSCLFDCLSVCLSDCLCVFLSICPALWLSVSVCLPVCLSVVQLCVVCSFIRALVWFVSLFVCPYVSLFAKSSTKIYRVVYPIKPSEFLFYFREIAEDLLFANKMASGFCGVQ